MAPALGSRSLHSLTLEDHIAIFAHLEAEVMRLHLIPRQIILRLSKADDERLCTPYAQHFSLGDGLMSAGTEQSYHQLAGLMLLGPFLTGTLCS